MPTVPKYIMFGSLNKKIPKHITIYKQIFVQMTYSQYPTSLMTRPSKNILYITFYLRHSALPLLIHYHVRDDHIYCSPTQWPCVSLSLFFSTQVQYSQWKQNKVRQKKDRERHDHHVRATMDMTILNAIVYRKQ